MPSITVCSTKAVFGFHDASKKTEYLILMEAKNILAKVGKSRCISRPLEGWMGVAGFILLRI